MVPALAGAVAAIVASVVIAANAVSPRASAGSFGASVPVRIAHVGSIEVDLRATGSSRLVSVPCAAVSRIGTSCFVRSAGR